MDPPDIPILSDFAFHADVWKVVIGWTCVLVFSITAILTILAVSGFPVLADRKYRDRLFLILVVEVAGIGALFFGNALSVGQAPPVDVYSVTEGPHGCDYGHVEAFCRQGDILIAGGGSCGYCSSVGRMETSVPIGRDDRMGWLLACDEGGSEGAEYDGGRVVVYCQGGE